MRNYTLLHSTAQVAFDFDKMQREKTEEKKLLATRLALNWLKLNNWDENAPDYAEVYQTAWIEKMLLVETAYGVNEILSIAQELKQQNNKLLADVGIIVSRTGEILKNQEVIITQNGQILDITGQILDVTTENLAVTYEVLGNVKDIKATVNDMEQNGVKIRQNNYQGGSKTNYVKIIVIAGLILVAIVFVKKKFGKKKGGK